MTDIKLELTSLECARLHRAQEKALKKMDCIESYRILPNAVEITGNKDGSSIAYRFYDDGKATGVIGVQLMSITS